MEYQGEERKQDENDYIIFEQTFVKYLGVWREIKKDYEWDVFPTKRKASTQPRGI